MSRGLVRGLVVPGGAGGGGGITNVNISAGTTSNLLSALTFADANGLAFGLNGSTLTGSYTVPSTAGLLSNIRLSAGTTSNLASAFTFGDGNNVSFGLNAGTITGSVATSLTNLRLSAGTTSNLASAFTLADSNGISFGLNAGTLTATVKTDYQSSNANYLTSQSNQALSGQNGSFTFQTATFSNANGISFGTSAGPAITASHNALTSQSNQALSAANGSYTFQTAQFHNSHGISWSTTTGSGIIASHNAVTTQTNQQMTLFATGNTTLSSTGTSNASSLVFRGSGAASVGITAGSILIDVAAGAAAITQSIGMSTQTAGGGTGGTTGYATGDDILYHFVPGSNITMSQSINGASGTLSIYGPAAGGGATLSGWNPFPNPALWVTSGIGNASLFLRPVDVPAAFQYDCMAFPMHFSQATNSTLTVSNSVAWGFYSRNASTLSLYKSGSGTFSINGSGTASSANNSGIRVVSLASTDTITAGNYYLGFVWRTSSAGANASLSYLAVSQWASTISGYLGIATNSRIAYHPAGGVWTSTTAGPVPASIAFSDIRGNSSAFQRQPILHFTSGEITF